MAARKPLALTLGERDLSILPERRRLAYALLLSLLLHALLLRLTFDNQGLWVPGFSFPWRVGRVEVPDLHVALVPAPVTPANPAGMPVAEPLQPAGVEQPVASGPPPTVSRAPTAGPFAASIASETSPRTDASPPAEAKPRTVAKPRADTKPRADAKPNTGTKPRKVATTAVARPEAHLGADQRGDTAPPPPAPDVIALERTDESTWLIPAIPPTPPPVIAAEPSTSSTQTVTPSLRDADDAAREQIDREASEPAVEPAKSDPSKQEGQQQGEQLKAAREDAARREAARAERARLETERQQTALQEAARREGERQETERVEAARAEAARAEVATAEVARAEAARAEAARVETARIEAARIEAARIEAARVEMARIEAARIEAARIEAARIEAARIEAARIEAARIEAARAEAARAEAAGAEAARAEAARAEAARGEAARAEAARIEAAQAATARVEAARRAIGRQLDEEAARRDAAKTAERQSPSWGPARRYRLFGRTDPNEEIILYAEAWARKIHLNMTFDMVREAAKQPHADPLVTVAIRSDGSVESVTFVQSSGVPAIDEAIRRIVDSQTPYQVFPPALARDYDVIEIRRTWHFDVAIRLY